MALALAICRNSIRSMTHQGRGESRRRLLCCAGANVLRPISRQPSGTARHGPVSARSLPAAAGANSLRWLGLDGDHSIARPPERRPGSHRRVSAFLEVGRHE